MRLNHAYRRLNGLIVLGLCIGLLLPNSGFSKTLHDEKTICKQQIKGEFFAKTELYFGLSKPENGSISEQDFQTFMDKEVTPRFPEGLTLINAAGQYQIASGAIIKEASKLLILFYPFSKTKNQQIEQIRAAYKKQFQQESVLRVDQINCIAF